MDTSDPDIKFDENGFCNHCNDYFRIGTFYLKNKINGWKELEKLVKRIKKKQRGREYEVVVGVSGGVDSSYVAYLTKKLGLRTLLVHFDNGWDTELAVKNIENLVNKLGFDFQTEVVNLVEFKDIQLSFLKASVANVEIPTDHAFLAALYKLCNQYSIKYIFSGSNFVTERILPKSWGYNAKDLRHLKAIHKKYGSIKLKTFPMLGIFKEIYFTYFRGIKMIRVLDYINYNKFEAIETLTNEYNWRYYGGKHYESRFTKFFQAYILPKKFGIDKRRAHLSSLICSGQISREKALETMKQELYPLSQLKEDKEYIIKKLGLSEEKFSSIIKLPVKNYRDYPSLEKLNHVIYSIYYFFIKRRKWW